MSITPNAPQAGFRNMPAVSGLTDFTRTRVMIYQSGREAQVAMTEFASVIAKTFAFQSFTAAEIADGNHVVNTEGKVAGRAVWDTTNNRLMIATGPGQVDPWQVFEAASSLTPA